MALIRMMANRGLLKIFSALLLVAVTMFACTYTVYRNSIAGIYEQFSENNKLVVKNMIRSFDESFQKINDIVFAVNVLPYEVWDPAGGGRVDLHDAYLMREKLSQLISSTDYIEEVVVFSEHSDLTVTSAGTTRFSELFAQKYKHKVNNADYWKSFAASNRPQKVFAVEDYTETIPGLGERTRKLIVVMGNTQLSDYNVMVLIDAPELLRHVNLTGMMNGTSLIVLDQDKKVILSTAPDFDLVEVLNEVYFNSGPEATLKKQDYEYHFFKSDYNDFIYIDKIPYRFQNIRSVIDTNRLIMLGALVLAVLLSAALSFYLFKPVRDLVKLFGGRLAGEGDYRSIYSGILRLREENESFKTRMHFIDSEIRRGVFLHALDGYAHSRELELQIQNYFSDFFRDRQFVLAAFHVQSRAEGELAASLRVEEVGEALQRGLRARLEQAAVFHTGNLRYLALIGIQQSSDRKNVLRQIRELIRAGESEGLSNFSMLVTVSRTYASKFGNVQLAHRDLLECIVYRNVDDGDRVVDIEAIRRTWKIYFPADDLEKLSSCLIGGDEAEAIRIASRLIDKNAEQGIGHHQLAPLAQSLFFYMLRHVDLTEKDEKELLALESAFLLKVEQAGDYRDIREALMQAVRYAAKKTRADPKSKLDAAFIAKYIELNYADNLHLEHMAGVLGTSPKYFSTYFKKAFGVNFVEYLNKVRLSHAKHYLKTTDLSVTEVGEKTGYLNASTFASTFKKYTGLSPSEYRKQNAG